MKTASEYRSSFLKQFKNKNMIKTESKFETITVEKAKKMLEMNTSNRPINNSNLEFIVSEIKKNNFHLTGESIKIAKNGNLLDGQHRLLAIVKTGIPIKTLVVRGLDDDAFKYIDTGKSRKASDVLGIMNIENSNRMASIAKFIISFSQNRFSDTAHYTSRKKITNAYIAEYIEKNIESVKDSYKFGFCKENKLLSGITLASLHFIFKKINADEANDFCSKLAEGNDLTKTSPIYLLRQKLMQDLRVIRKMPNLEKIALICKSWNLYRSKKHVNVLRWDIKRDSFPKPI